MEDRLWIHLLRNEPSVEELTKKEYEDYHRIGSIGQASKQIKNVSGAVGKGAKKKDEPSVHGTRPQILKTLRERGFDYKDLKSKTKQQLIELL